MNEQAEALSKVEELTERSGDDIAEIGTDLAVMDMTVSAAMDDVTATHRTVWPPCLNLLYSCTVWGVKGPAC